MLKPEIIKPESREHWLALRTHDITSTEVAALFGCSPYMTAFELFHRKKSRVTVQLPLEDSERMKWGSRLQDSIAHGLAEDSGFAIRRMDEYMRLPGLHIGASFDFSIESPELAILEVKNVDALQYKEKWIVDDDHIEAPEHIEFQLQAQLAVSGREVGYIGALTGGNRGVLIRRAANKEVHEAIYVKVAEFWRRVAQNDPPPVDYQRDFGIIKELYSKSIEGKVIEAPEGVGMYASMYREISEQIKMLEAKKNEVRARILERIGDASKVTGNGFTISAGHIGECVVKEHTREARRDFRINWKKVKE